MNKDFTLRDTNICKGIAILFMILHHCVGKYYTSFNPSWYAENSYGISSLLILFLSTAGKVCVSLFSILSGFGTTKSYISYSNSNPTIRFGNVRFVFSKLIKFYSLYFICFIVRFLLSITRLKHQFLSFYSMDYSFRQALCFFLLDFSGLSQFFQVPRLLPNWYIPAIMLFYIFFPLLQFITKKLKFAAFFLAFLPQLYAVCCGKEIPDEFVYYILPFVVGIYLAQNNVFERLNKYRGMKASLFSVLLVCIFFALRLIFAIPIDCLFGLSIILFEYFALSQLKFCNSILAYIGKYSANMWILHGKFINSEANLSMRFLKAFTISFLLSVGIEALKDASGFNGFFKKIRNSLCKA